MTVTGLRQINMIIIRGFGKESKGEVEQEFITECSRKIKRQTSRTAYGTQYTRYSHEWHWHKH